LTLHRIENQLNFLFSLQRKGIKLGLNHTRDLLGHINNPEKELIMIHIAGTNGKGSTAACLNSILIESGYKVGLYTSPHLIKFNERIRVNGKPIKDDEILDFMDNVKGAIKKINSTFFETTTAMALNYFKDKNVDIAIIETGLGGRLDSTNVIKPVLTIITAISLDHADILGDSIEKIAHEKAGIIKENVPLIIAPQKKSVMKILKNRASEKNSEIIEVNTPQEVKIGENGTSFKIIDENLSTNLIGDYQAQNISVAIAAIRYFNKSITYKLINEAIKKINWPGRMHRVSKQIFYDVAHNDAGIGHLLGTVNNLFPNSDLYGVFCLKGDKDIVNLAKQIKNRFKKLYISSDKNGLLLNASDFSKKLMDLNVKNYKDSSIKSCIKKLKSISKSNDIILIFGTHYIAEEVFKEFEIPFDTGII